MTKPRVHFIGIGGIGTSALARWFLSHNYIVSGSDVSPSEIISELKKQGVKIFIGHKAKNLPKEANLAIFSAAVPADNPERRQAAKLGIPVKSYSEAVGDLTKQYKTIAVAGAHGKSTTTALLSLVLIKANFDPTVIVGTKLKEFGDSNFRNGKGDYLVLEADEYNDSFLNYSPTAVIILNIDREHLDYYKNLAVIKKSFLKFIDNIRPNGILVLNKDDKNLLSLKNKIQKISQKKKLKVFWYGIIGHPMSQILTKKLRTSDVQKLKSVLKILGEHNVSNALAVYTLTKALNVKEKDILGAISRYRGAWRRMEYRGELKTKNSKLKAKIYDDYAHHPTEIKATLAGIARKWPKTGLICVFQPHQAKRLSLLFKDFVGAFNEVNYLILLDIYKVAGREKLSQNVSSKKLATAIKNRLVKPRTHYSKLKTVIYLPHPRELKQVLNNLLKTQNSKLKTVIVMMGAGDIYKLTDKLLQ